MLVLFLWMDESQLQPPNVYANILIVAAAQKRWTQTTEIKHFNWRVKMKT